jgi:SAM-dependent methyltransferase
MSLHSFLEDVTEANFNEVSYLAANSDVAAAGVPARLHYEKFGKFESRKQLVSSPPDEYWKSRYAHFRHILQDPYGNDASGSFPLIVGTSVHDLMTYPRESANNGNGIFENEILNNPNGIYIDLGCGLRDRTFDNCLYVEVYNARCADLVVEPNCTYPIKDASVDGIGCFAVLEHTRKPWLVVSEMRRIVKPGGKVFIDWPFLQPVHGYPSHYFNATREGLSSLFTDNGFSIISCDTLPHQTVAHTVHWILDVMWRRLPYGKIRRQFEKMTVKDLIALDRNGKTWGQFIAALDDKAKEELACGNTLVASKL